MVFCGHLTSGISLALICLLVQTKSSGSLSIARGENDSVWFDKDYQYDEMVNYTDDTTLDCSKKTKICRCKASDGYTTLIYNHNTKRVKCVKDESNVLGIIGHDGMCLKTKNGSCLTATESDGKIHAGECNRRANQWLLVAIFQLLNLRTLKCLQRGKDPQKLTTEQCKSEEDTQKWSPKNIGNRMMFNDTLFETEPFSYQRYYSRYYQGCYRISKNKFIGVVKKSPHCKRASQKDCSIPITINAPVFYGETSTCNIIWGKSTYSIYGQVWKPFPPGAESLFILKKVNQESVNLTVSNMDLFERWSGTLIKLHIECGSERENCVFLKIKSSRRKNETPTIASATTSSVVTTSSTSYSTSSPIKKDKMSSLLFVIPVVVLLCLVIAAIIVVYCRRRRKRINSKKDNHVYEETTANKEMIGYEDPAQITEMQRISPSTYESPGLTISTGNHYEYPTNDPTPQNSLKNPRNNNNFQYDYATREETSLLPLILSGDVILEDDTSRNADNTPGTSKKSQKRDVPTGQPQEKPLYHTLEEDTSDLPHPCEEPDTHAGHSGDQPVYHTLENGDENLHQIDSQ